MEGLVGILILYAVLAVIGAAQRKQQGAKKPPGGERHPNSPPSNRAETKEQILARSPTVRPGTQSEGLDLDRWLRQLPGAESAGSGRRPARRLPAGGGTEERMRSDRPAREQVDYDEQAEEVAARRLRRAAERNRALTLADHQAFDARIRDPEAGSVPSVQRRRSVTIPQSDLRKAVVWSEILRPPVSLR